MVKPNKSMRALEAKYKKIARELRASKRANARMKLERFLDMQKLGTLEAKYKKVTEELRASKHYENMYKGHVLGNEFEIDYLKDEIQDLRDALSGAREIAFAMVTHPRLGQDSLLCRLEPRLIQRIVAMSM